MALVEPHLILSSTCKVCKLIVSKMRNGECVYISIRAVCVHGIMAHLVLSTSVCQVVPGHHRLGGSPSLYRTIGLPDLLQSTLGSSGVLPLEDLKNI